MIKTKEFRDPVHGYIPVPDEYCDLLIDTPIFQRLREVEQTGMRVLFPGARHCRFSHSLGTYFLGSRAFKHFRDNSRSFFAKDDDTWAAYEKTFRIACLLHDCGHAPFSHTFEHYYDYVEGEEKSRLKAPLLAAANDDIFASDYTGKASAHEKASALLVLTRFDEPIRALGGDPLLVARMILGCKHLGAKDETERIENCLISLLNGPAIDVDKLDYILRDTWASGVNNVSIDVPRLLGALTYDPDRCHVAFRKSAMSVLQAVIDGRNHLYRWIFGHHKVVYNQHLMKTAVEALAKLICGKREHFLSSFFSVDAFSQPVTITEDVSAYLPTDQDLAYLLKKYAGQIPEVKEYLSRQHSCVPLWKTAVEFSCLFGKKTEEERTHIRWHARDMIVEMVNDKSSAPKIIVEDIPEKFVTFEASLKQILIEIDGVCHSYDQLFKGEGSIEPSGGFYVFVPTNLIGQKQSFIKRLQSVTI